MYTLDVQQAIVARPAHVLFSYVKCAGALRTMVENRWGREVRTPSRVSQIYSSNLACISTVTVNILMIFVGLFISMYMYEYRELTDNYTAFGEEQEVVKLLGAKGALLYKSLDRNRDGNISCSEFGPIVEKLTGEVCRQESCILLKYLASDR